MFDPRKLFLLLVACGSTMACAQTGPGVNRTTSTATSSHSAKRAPGSLANHKSVPVDLEYWLFITDKARDHESIQKEIRNNPGRFPADIELRDMSMHIGIRPEEYATVLTHILDANNRLKENEKEWRAALSEFQNGADPSSPELMALDKEHDAVIQETIRSLKHELCGESFQKLNSWVDLYFRSETSAPATETEPSQPRLFTDPSTLQAPVVET